VSAFAAYLQREQDENGGNENCKQQHNLPFNAPLLVARRDLELLAGLFDIPSHVFNIVVNTIQHTALVDDHGLQLLENVGELNDALGDVINFALAMGNEGFVGIVTQALLLGLEQGRLGEGAVGIGVEEGGIVVGILHRRGGTVGRGQAAEVTHLWRHCQRAGPRGQVLSVCEEGLWGALGRRAAYS